MTWLTKWSFKNKAAVIVLTVLVLAMGAISYFQLPMEFLPEADNPQVSVIVFGQGADANTMSDLVTEPLEQAVSTVQGKREVFSMSGDGYTRLDLMFEPGVDMKKAKADVKEMVDGVQLPQGFSKPTIVQLNTTMIPIADISVGFEDGVTKENVDFTKKEILPVLQKVDGVGSVALYGETQPFVSIKLDNVKLAQKQVPAQAVMGLLQGQNVAMAVGEKIVDGKQSNIKVVGTIDDVQTLKDLPVAPNVTLADVATVEVKTDENTLTRVNGKDVLVMIVTKDGNSNAVAIVKKMRKEIEKLNKEFTNSEVSVFISTTDMVENGVNSMMKEVLLGAVFATIVIMLFLRNIRSTLITIVSIPLSLCMTLFLLSKSGVTLNILTLGGVAVAVGRLVDDSIVVIENIFRKTQKGEFSIGLVIESTKEVAAAITSSTLTTVAVFLPIGLVGGGLEDFMLPFALTVTYSLLSSLVVALTIVPLMSSALLKNAKLPAHKEPKRFMKLLTWSLNHKWVVILLSFMVFIGSVGVYFNLPKGTINSSDADMIAVSLDYPNDTPIDTVKEKAVELEKFLLEQSEPEYVFTQLGNSADGAKFGMINSPTKVTYTVMMKDDVDAEHFIKQVETQKSNYPGADLTAGAGDLTGGNSTAVTLDIIGNNIDDIEATAGKVKTAIKDIDGVEKVSTNQDAKKPVYNVVVDPAAANPQQLAQQLGMMLNRMPMGTINMDGKSSTVFMEPTIDPKSEGDIKNIPIQTPAGIVPMATVAKVELKEQSSAVLHKGGKPYLRVTAIVDPAMLSIVNGDIKTAVFGTKDKKGIDIPKGTEVFVGGASTQQASDFNDLFVTMLASIGIVYLIMVITFKTIRTPIAILFSLPLAAIGAVLGILVTGISVDITALLGALMLIGIVVTNAIVLLDRVRHNEETMTIRESLIEAAGTRMRPIFMTAVATICAMLPLLFKDAETGGIVSKSLAIVVVGGLAVATVLTLVVIPVIYELLYFRKSKKQRMAQSKAVPGSELSA